MIYVIPSPVAGSVLTICCEVGDKVTNGQDVIELESMKMLIPIVAPFNGIITAILVQTGTIVAEDDELFRMEDGKNG